MKFRAFWVTSLAICCLASAADAQEQAAASPPTTQIIQFNDPAALYLISRLDRARKGMPWGFPQYLEAAPEPITLTTGSVARDEVVLSIPFKHKIPITTKTSFSVKKRTVPVGAIGFKIDDFYYDNKVILITNVGLIPLRVKKKPYNVYCFFQADGKFDYADPVCALNIRRGSGGSWAGLESSSNIIVEIPYTGSGNKGTPDASPLNEGIPHDFRLELKVDSWDEKGARLQWLSDGKAVDSEVLKPAADGAITFDLPSGVIRLKADGLDKSRTVVMFTAKP